MITKIESAQAAQCFGRFLEYCIKDPDPEAQDKYQDEFEKMYQKVKDGKNPSLVIAEHFNFFEEKGEGVGHLGLIDYFSKYIKER